MHVMTLYSMDQYCPLDGIDKEENIIEKYECLNELMKTKMLLLIEQDSIIEIMEEDKFFEEKYQKTQNKINQINQEIISYYRSLKIEQLVHGVQRGKKS